LKVDLLGAADTIIQGVLLGSLYALFALGLSLMFGVMRIVNTAHGDLVILAGFGGVFLNQAFGVGAFTTMLAVVPLAFALGYGLQRSVLNRTLSRDPLPSLVVTFGISIVIQNLLLELFSADTRSLSAGGLEARSIEIVPGLAVGVLPVMVLAAALTASAGFQWLFGRTRLGRAFRATSDDGEAASLVGIDNHRVFALATGLAIGILGIAGVFQAMRTTISPTDGPAQLIYAFESVIIGGMGSFWGTFVGGLILGVSQAIGFRINPGWGILVGHLVFVAVLVVRPMGLFPKTAA
jgi:branched-chain amino acid transport system permease protein